jgi:hypothetical protein
MSRRHHGRPHHARKRTDTSRPAGPTAPAGGQTQGQQVVPETRPITTTDAAAAVRPRDPRPTDPRPGEPTILPGERIAPRPAAGPASSTNGVGPGVHGSGPSTNDSGPSTNGSGPSTNGRGAIAATSAPPPPAGAPSTMPGTHAAAAPLGNGHAERPYTNGHAGPTTNGPGGPPSNGCTAPQLRRFIKSRPYVPMHELRRRFGILGTDDDVTQVRLDHQAIYVGLPQREGALLGDLLRGGEIGCELSLDPRTPVVIGVYPMRPVPRG